MPRIYSDSSWRQLIYTSLRKRNKSEHENIKEFIFAYNRLFDQSEVLRYETKQLSFQNEKLQEELLQTTRNVTSTPSPSPSTSSASPIVQQLEQKIYKLQEEVTDLHRRRSENSQQLVELNQCLQERDKLLASTQNKLADKETELMFAKENLAAKDSKLQEVEGLNQLLRDEYQALNLICTSLEEKNKKLQEEIHELIERWMNLKAKDAEKLNQENEAALRKRQELVEKNLKEACLEPRLVVEEDKFSTVSPVSISSSLPSKSYLNFDAHEGEVNAVIFGSKGKVLASGGSDRKIKLWDISHGTLDQKGMLTGSNAGVNAIDFDDEERLVLGASNDLTCRVWTTCDLRQRVTLTGHSGKVMASKFLSESSKVVTGSYDRTLKIWDLRSRACTKTLFAGSSCNDIAVSDSQLTTVVSGHFDKTVKFWDIRHEEAVSTVDLQGKVTSLSLSFDNFYLLCSVRDDSLKIVDLRTNRICNTLTHDGFHIGADYSRAVFSPDGIYAVSGSKSGSLIIWNVRTSEIVKELQEHTSCVLATAWHPDGTMLASCDKTKKIIVWRDF